MFEAGDIVRVRQWDDMAKEFGLEENGNIRVQFSFTKAMRRYCGTIGEVESVDSTGCVHFVDGVLRHLSGGIEYFTCSFSEGMLELAESVPDFDMSEWAELVVI